MKKVPMLLNSKSLIIVLFFILTAKQDACAKLVITADYDNGHIQSGARINETGDKATVNFGPVSSDKETWFNFKITGCKDKTVNFSCSFKGAKTERKVISDFHVVSYKPFLKVYDNSYEMMDCSYSDGVTETYSHTFREDTAYVSFSYVVSNTMIDNYINEIRENPFVKVEILGKSTFYDLPLYMVTVTDKTVPDKNKKTICLITREDSYEAGGNVALLGALRYLLSKEPSAVEIRKRFVYLFMPLFSRDGVKIGATNFPLDAKGDNFVYFPPNFLNNENKIKEAEMLKNYFIDWKSKGKTIDAYHSMHCNPFGGSGFFYRPDPDNPESKTKTKEYISALRKVCLPHYEVTSASPPAIVKYIFRYLQKEFKTLAVNTHSDAVFKKQRLCVEDNYQDGELFVRGIASFFGTEIPENVPPFLLAENVSRYRCKEKDKVIFSMLYKDVLGRDPEYIKVVIGGRSYNMEKTGEGPNIKGVAYKCEVTIELPVNDYYIEASNGVSKRRMPETYLQLGPYIPK